MDELKKKIHLIMPMGGAGSRFFKDGYVMPKPLIELLGKPFLFWATNSVVKFIEIEDLTFVVLQEHIDEFNIDSEIKKYFPMANIVALPKMLNGAVLTCIEGVRNINDDLPLVFNDCDHAFYSEEFNLYCNNGIFDMMDGALLTFQSTDPKYSFLMLNDAGNVIKTIEKQVISDKAICGAYYFKNKDIFLKMTQEYLENCNYNEYFMSGVYNVMAEKSLIVKNFNCDEHISFGTPSEYEEVKRAKKIRRYM